ncbi:MAG: tRNA pseudouridine(38-40) synthase TruA [Bacteroidales bacterium]|nr:tRNA pseudouridine(38-40) synthase TruA [Bacteroidales bacterium]
MSYLGTNYHGWQIQPNAITVQETLNKAMSVLLNETISATGAGRTDTGVHARFFVAHFDSENEDLMDNDKFLYKLNSILPKDIALYNIKKVKPDANCRYDAISRTYEYYITRKKNPFSIAFSYPLYLPLDIKKMQVATKILFEYTDFSCFSKSNTDTKTNNCRIMNAQWNMLEDMLVFSITADRFLRNMVRAIIGTILEVGLKKMDVDEIHKIIQSKDRSKAGYSVPAQGLHLTEITYPQSIYL